MCTKIIYAKIFRIPESSIIPLFVLFFVNVLFVTKTLRNVESIVHNIRGIPRIKLFLCCDSFEFYMRYLIELAKLTHWVILIRTRSSKLVPNLEIFFFDFVMSYLYFENLPNLLLWK